MLATGSLEFDDKKDGDVLVQERDVGGHTVSGGEVEIDEAYLAAPRFSRFYRSVLCQMILLGLISFVGNSMSSAISNLGGGGLSSPFLSNLATSLNYVGSFLVTSIGGPLLNKMGIKYMCAIAGLAFPLNGSAYYTTVKYDSAHWTQVYLLVAKFLNGIALGFTYVAETTAMLSYPYLEDRGYYLGIWSAMQNTGAVFGGAINFGTNYARANSGGVSDSTYLVFTALEATGPFWGLLLSPTKWVRRHDGSKVGYQAGEPWKVELKALYAHVRTKRTALMFFPAVYSFFYGGVYGTYLSQHFSVRARALSTLITPAVTIVIVLFYGRFVLDNNRLTVKQRAYIAVGLCVVFQAAGFIWTGIEYGKYGSGKATLDYKTTPSAWAKAWIPYLIIFSTGYWTQLCCYWILGTFSTDVKNAARTGGLFRAMEVIGQAISYGINSKSSDIRIPFYINCAIFAIAIPCFYGLIQMVPEKPADHDDVVDADAVTQAVVQAKLEGVNGPGA
ncbi:hypothetical protein Q5752_005425 [Cryptotrichosporon argae]